MSNDNTDQKARPIAVIGMSCVYAGANGLRQFWQNIVNKVDAITEVDPKRWDPEVFYDPDPTAEDKICCKKGGWIGTSFRFNPIKYGTMPRAVSGAEPDQFLVLRTVYEALADAGYMERDLGGQRTSFILGRGNYLGAGLTGLLQRGIITQQTLAVIKRLHPEYTQADLDLIRDALRADLPEFNPETAPGLIPNLTAGRVANRLDFMGSAFTVDAACASSLIAVEIGIQNLLSGRDDCVLAGGAHVFSDLPFMQVFDAMGALSPSATIRPFDRHCDGTIAGEGVGILVLKRLEDAERDGDRIYAVIRGVGVSSDGRAKSVTAPRSEGEELALRRAYDACGVDPESIGLVEAHGTGTPIGDATEAEVLQRVFAAGATRNPACALGSIKSMIGHAMPAAGAAGLIKTALSLYHRVLPPTLHCDEPLESLQSGRVYVNTETRPWIQAPDRSPRRAAVNTFGFGGVNAHVIMEAYEREVSENRPSLQTVWKTELIVLEAPTRAALLEEISGLQAYLAEACGIELRDLAYTCNAGLHGEPFRIALVASSLPNLQKRLQTAFDRLQDPGCIRMQDTLGIYYFEDRDLRAGKVAFLFPGEGSQYLNMLAELCMHFPDVRRCFDEADQAVAGGRGLPPSAVLFPPPFFSAAQEREAEARLWEIEHATEAVLTADGALYRLMNIVGLQPDMIAGHSAGEWVAMAAAGILDIDEFVQSMDRLNAMYGTLARNTDIPKMSMLAVATGRDQVMELVAELGCSVSIANDNCDQQVVIVAASEDAQRIVKHLLAKNIYAEKLPYDRGYHTPAFTCICEPLRGYFRSLSIRAPKIPLYCCTTAQQYPAAADEIIEIAANTFTRPLLFRDTVEAMYRDGARVFVEVGPRGNLTAFVDNILQGKAHLAVAADKFRKSDISALQHALGVLAALGKPLDLSCLYAHRSPRLLSLDSARDALPREQDEPGCMEVSLCYPGLQTAHLEPPQPHRAVDEAPAAAPELSAPAPGAAAQPAPVQSAAPASPLPGGAGDQALEQHFQLMEKFLQVHQEVMHGYLGGQAASPQPSGQEPDIYDVLLQHPAAEPNQQQLPDDQAASGPAVPAATPDFAGPAAQSIQDALLGIVSDRTGYPLDMLDLDVDIEADLGIDSIKRVEIFSALGELAPGSAAAGVGMEEISTRKTLRQIIELLDPGQDSAARGTPVASAADPLAGRPLLAPATVLQYTPGMEIKIECVVRSDEHRYLADHSLDHAGTKGSGGASRSPGMAVVPLTVSIELMAECATALMQPLQVVEARNVQALKWIDVEGGSAALVLTAQKAGDHSVQVTIERTTAAGGLETVARATMVVAAAFPAVPAPAPVALTHPRRPLATAGQMYSERRMFHGPRFQGVCALEAVGENGLEAQLKVLPMDNLLASNPAPAFILDPFLLDAAGQLVGYWPVEYLSEGFVMFPIRIESLKLYGPVRTPGETARCALRLRDVSQRQLSADLDIIAPDGTLWMQVQGWEDWRFYWPQTFYDFWRFPDRYMNSRLVGIPGNGSNNFSCCRLDAIPEMDSGVWENLWAHIILTGTELEQYQTFPAGPDRSAWIHERAVAKDAVRIWMKQRHNRDVYPAEIDIRHGGNGSTAPHEAQVSGLPETLHVSTAHRGRVAVAAAGPRQLGIELNPLDAQNETAGRPELFSSQEHGLLRRMGIEERAEFVRFAMCAKKAVDNASMTGRVFQIQDVNMQDGSFLVNDGAADGANSGPFIARSTVDDGYVVAVAVEGEGAQDNA